MESTENKVAKKLVEHFGGRSQAAHALNRSTEAIRLWLENGIPLSQAIDVEQKTGGIITAEQILRDAKAVAREAERAA